MITEMRTVLEDIDPFGMVRLAVLSTHSIYWSGLHRKYSYVSATEG